MGKYDGLREYPSKEILGKQHTKASSCFLWRGKELTIIGGFPACPECGHTLSKVLSQSTWLCSSCGTVWTSLDLVQAVEAENTLVTVSIRNLEEE